MPEEIESKRLSDAKPEDRTEILEPLLGACFCFPVVSVIASGAFLDCGLPKDIFVPIGEQLKILQVGETPMVYVYRDKNTGRIAASSKLNKYLFDEAPENMREGDVVELLIYAKTAMGYKAVVQPDSWGLLYENEVFQALEPGQKVLGYIKKIRPDGRIDLALQKSGFQVVPDLSQKIMEHLKAAGGSCPFTDKTSPEEVYKLFGVSKKKFKMAVGNLYKHRQIVLEKTCIKLIHPVQ